jgi:hypothetical protein
MNKNQKTDDFSETAVMLLYQSKLHDENKQYIVANLVADRLIVCLTVQLRNLDCHVKKKTSLSSLDGSRLDLLLFKILHSHLTN